MEEEGQALEFLLSQGFENQGVSQHGLSIVYSDWVSIPNFSFRGYFNLDSEVTFLSILILMTAKYWWIILSFSKPLIFVYNFSSIQYDLSEAVQFIFISIKFSNFYSYMQWDNTMLSWPETLNVL